MSVSKARIEIQDHLREIGFSPSAISRIIDEDLPFLTTWELQESSPEALASADAVMAFAFGFGPALEGVQHPTGQYDPLLYHPGKTNEALADVIGPYAEKGLPVFAQWEVAEALRARQKAELCHCVARPDKEYLGTSGVVRQFLSEGLGKYKAVILVAHRHHAFRCQRIAAKVFAAEEGTADIRILIPSLPDVYDPDSVQPWTRSLEDWVRYEVGNRFHNRFQGNM